MSIRRSGKYRRGLTVAVASDTRPTDLPPIVDTIDPDGLSRLVHNSPTPAATTTFSYAGCTVTVRSSGDVVVGPGDALDRPH